MIPKSFEIFGETYKVKKLKRIDKEDSWGEYDPVKNIIKIKKDLTEDQQMQSFYHEILHVALDNLGYENLHRDEVFVDTLAKALYQITKSSK